MLLRRLSALLLPTAFAVQCLIGVINEGPTCYQVNLYVDDPPPYVRACV